MSRFLRKSFSFFLIFLLTENCIDSREEGEGIKSGGNEGWHIVCAIASMPAEVKEHDRCVTADNAPILPQQHQAVPLQCSPF